MADTLPFDGTRTRQKHTGKQQQDHNIGRRKKYPQQFGNDEAHAPKPLILDFQDITSRIARNKA